MPLVSFSQSDLISLLKSTEPKSSISLFSEYLESIHFLHCTPSKTLLSMMTGNIAAAITHHYITVYFYSADTFPQVLGFDYGPTKFSKANNIKILITNSFQISLDIYYAVEKSSSYCATSEKKLDWPNTSQKAFSSLPCSQSKTKHILLTFSC